ncbi:MAG: DNA repair protein RecO [Candidatus Latescibacteria bacterium]|jgi:DNA repair protein RecO (recombination protein O)|nr:DNA repair protein RecO [Candidatus Latescibacterota bacterium]
MICRAEGLVLRGYRMSGSSKVVVIYTRESGKLRLAARGARRPKSRFGASLEPITWGSYVYSRREGRDLQTLTEGDILYAFGGLKRDYRRMAHASAVCDLLDHMTAEEDRNGVLCSVALESLRWIESVADASVELPLWYFQLKAASALGYRPHLSGCVRCGSRLEDSGIRFSPVEGGTVCGHCGSSGSPLDRPTVTYLEQIQTGRPDRIDVEPFGRVDRGKVRGMLRTYLDYHVEARRRIRSLDFLDRMLAADGSEATYTVGDDKNEAR